MKHSAFDHSSARKFDDERAAMRQHVFDVDCPALCLDCESAERQAQPGCLKTAGSPKPLLRDLADALESLHERIGDAANDETINAAAGI